MEEILADVRRVEELNRQRAEEEREAQRIDELRVDARIVVGRWPFAVDEAPQSALASAVRVAQEFLRMTK